MDKLFLSLHHSLLEVDIHQIVDNFSSFLYFQLKCDQKWMMRRWPGVWCLGSSLTWPGRGQ